VQAESGLTSPFETETTIVMALDRRLSIASMMDGTNWRRFRLIHQ
jgi:hypothetical protein